MKNVVIIIAFWYLSPKKYQTPQSVIWYQTFSLSSWCTVTKIGEQHTTNIVSTACASWDKLSSLRARRLQFSEKSVKISNSFLVRFPLSIFCAIRSHSDSLKCVRIFWSWISNITRIYFKRSDASVSSIYVFCLTFLFFPARGANHSYFTGIDSVDLDRMSQSEIRNLFLTLQSLQVVVWVNFQGIGVGSFLFLTSWHASVGSSTALQQVALIISVVRPPSRSSH